MKKFRILLAGAWRWPIYEQSFAKALVENGCEVIAFPWGEFFKGHLGKIQKALPFPGPAMQKINRELLRLSKNIKPDIVLIWKGVYVFPSTINKMNESGVLTVSYNNDDPFGPTLHKSGPLRHRYQWFWYLRGLKWYKYNFFYRKINVDEAFRFGVRHADLLRSYFIPWKDRPLALTSDELKHFSCDVVFVGHYEPDERISYLRALVKSGLSVKLFGGEYWTSKVLGEMYSHFAPIVPAEGDDYSKALGGAKICLAFLSKMNRDTYTRRCFEIPACGGLMLAERTDDLLQLFEEDKEACFFSSSEELVSKAKWLVKNPEIAYSIARAGLERVWKDRNDVTSRAAQFLSLVVQESNL